MNLDINGQSLSINTDGARQFRGGYILNAPDLQVAFPMEVVRLYRHGWQSWSLAAWIDPKIPPKPISHKILGDKDEDPRYTKSQWHTSAWISAAELKDGSIVLLGALDMGGRIEWKDGVFHASYEDARGDWFFICGEEQSVFSTYASLLGDRLGRMRVTEAPRVWCSWYSLYGFVTEEFFLDCCKNLGDLPFDVFQLDDGWERSIGDWEANHKFPSGMAVVATRIKESDRKAGLWLAPFIASAKSQLVRQHPDWLLRDELGNPISAGITFSGEVFALDSSHPEYLAWLKTLIMKVRDWGYDYLKLDFLYAGAYPGVRKVTMPREVAYRQAMELVRSAAGDAYILACGAPIVPTLGCCDGMRVGPDVTPFWINTPMSVWMNNPNHPSARNALRSSLNRLWLQRVVQTDPDVVYFRKRHNALTSEQTELLHALALIAGFQACSDPPAWLSTSDREKLLKYLQGKPLIKRLSRYSFQIDGNTVDFEPYIHLPKYSNIPGSIAYVLGMYDMLVYEILPAISAVRRKR